MLDRHVADRILAAANLVESALDESISVRRMADAACYSLFHFCRQFNRRTWFSPYDYAIRRRLTHAAGQVVSTGLPLTRIALDHGFESSDGFARAFRRMFGTAPQYARESGEVDNRLFVSPLDSERLAVLGCCMPAPDTRRATDLRLSVTVQTARNVAEAGILAASGLHEDKDLWAGVCCEGVPCQSFIGHEGPDSSLPFEKSVPAGTYRTLHFTGDRSGTGILIELVYSTIIHRLPDCHPPPCLYVRPAQAGLTVLFECNPG